jgi:glycosyltransferase involved in cell wall biosynthesis
MVSDKNKPHQNIFVISEFVDKKRNSTGYYWGKIIEGLNESFNGISVICPKNNFTYLEPIKSVEYIPVRVPTFCNHKSLIFRLLYQSIQSFLIALKVIRNVRKNDLIFCGTNPLMLIFFLTLLKKIIKFKWVLLVHDVFPDNLIPAKVLNQSSLFYKLLTSLFNFIYTTPDELVAIGRDMQKILTDKIGVKRVSYIPNWVDPFDMPLLEHKSILLIKDKDFSDKVVFLFFGNMGRAQGIDHLLESIVSIKNNKAVFIFVGCGSEDYLIDKYKSNYPNSNIYHSPSVPFDQNSSVLSACDIAIISLAKGMRGLAVPSKAYFSMAADKPLFVIGDNDTELSNLILENPRLGWFCEILDHEAFEAIVNRICSENLDIYKTIPRSFLVDHFSYKLAIRKYVKLIKIYR